MLGGSLQFIALGWAKHWCRSCTRCCPCIRRCYHHGTWETSVKESLSPRVAIPICSCWSFLDHDRSYPLVIWSTLPMLLKRWFQRCRTLTLFFFKTFVSLFLQPLLMIPAETVKTALEAMPKWLADGMQIGGGMVVAAVMPWLSTWWLAVKYGHSLPLVLLLQPLAIDLIALGAPVLLLLTYLSLSKKGGNGGGGAKHLTIQSATFSKTIKKGVTLSWLKITII